MAGFGPISRRMAENGDERPRLKINATCPSCGSFLEGWTTFYRCPWTTTNRGVLHAIDGVDAWACDWPYGSRQGPLDAPITGRMSR